MDLPAFPLDHFVDDCFLFIRPESLEVSVTVLILLRQLVPEVSGRFRGFILADYVRLPVDFGEDDEIDGVMHRSQTVGQRYRGGGVFEGFSRVSHPVERASYCVLEFLGILLHGFVILRVAGDEDLVIQIVASVGFLDHCAPASGAGDAECHAVSVA